MTKEEGAAVVEAILFTMGDSVEISALAKAMETDAKEVKGFIEYLKEKYEKADSGIGILELEKSVQLCTKKEMYEYLVRIAKAPTRRTTTTYACSAHPLRSAGFRSPRWRCSLS